MAELERRVYLISPWRRAVLWWVLGPFLVLGLGFGIWGDDESMHLAGGVVVVIMSVFLAGWEWLVARTRLELNPEGARLRQLGMNLEAPWAQIEGLRLVRGREGFITREPLQGKGAARLATLRGIGAYGAPLYDDEQRAFMAERRWIPIEPFGWHFQHGTLTADIGRFAPHLQIVSTPTTVKSGMTKNTALIFVAIIIVAIGAAVALSFASEENQFGIMTVLQALVTPFLVLRTGWSARNSFRAHATLLGFLFSGLTLIVACWGLLAWAELLAIGAR